MLPMTTTDNQPESGHIMVNLGVLCSIGLNQRVSQPVAGHTMSPYVRYDEPIDDMAKQQPQSRQRGLLYTL